MIKDRWIIIFRHNVQRSDTNRHYKWLKNHDHQLHSKWHNYHGFEAYVISGPNSTIESIRNHETVYLIQKENTFTAKLNLKPGNKKVCKTIYVKFASMSGSVIKKKSSVDIYILDSGIDVTHPDFEGRASWGWPNEKREDIFGHGTHVAGIAGSIHYGVAKNANLIAVKVLNDYGMGSSSSILNGVHYVLDQVNRNPSRKAIINISFSGPKDLAVDHILNIAVQKGIAVVAAAGNDDSDACNFSPARSSSVLTVGAINDQKSKTRFSNYGSCVNVWALGVSVESLWPNGQTHILNGTSTSAPRIAGYLALLWSHRLKLSLDELYKIVKHEIKE